MKADDGKMVIAFCLASAAMGNYRTIYHDRIDGLLMPVLVNPVLRKFARKLRNENEQT